MPVQKPSRHPYQTASATSMEDDRRRDELLLRLLKTPPHPRPKRERDRKKTTHTSESGASAEKPATAV
jgi:hypothetical protein